MHMHGANGVRRVGGVNKTDAMADKYLRLNLVAALR